METAVDLKPKDKWGPFIQTGPKLVYVLVQTLVLAEGVALGSLVAAPGRLLSKLSYDVRPVRLATHTVMFHSFDGVTYGGSCVGTSGAFILTSVVVEEEFGGVEVLVASTEGLFLQVYSVGCTQSIGSAAVQLALVVDVVHTRLQADIGGRGDCCSTVLFTEILSSCLSGLAPWR